MREAPALAALIGPRDLAAKMNCQCDTQAEKHEPDDGRAPQRLQRGSRCLGILVVADNPGTLSIPFDQDMSKDVALIVDLGIPHYETLTHMLFLHGFGFGLPKFGKHGIADAPNCDSRCLFRKVGMPGRQIWVSDNPLFVRKNKDGPTTCIADLADKVGKVVQRYKRQDDSDKPAVAAYGSAHS